jgi:hypothetical protein
MGVLATEVVAVDKTYIEWTDQLRKAVAIHVNANGTLSPATNPED